VYKFQVRNKIFIEDEEDFVYEENRLASGGIEECFVAALKHTDLECAKVVALSWQRQAHVSELLAFDLQEVFGLVEVDILHLAVQHGLHFIQYLQPPPLITQKRVHGHSHLYSALFL